MCISFTYIHISCIKICAHICESYLDFAYCFPLCYKHNAYKRLPEQGGVVFLLVLKVKLFTLPESNIFVPENGWLEYDRFRLEWPIFRG